MGSLTPLDRASLEAPTRVQALFRKTEPYLYLLPALLLVGGLLLYSVAYTFAISFTDWDLISPPRFVGLQNYIDAIRDPTFKRSFTNTLVWTGGSLLLPVGGRPAAGGSFGAYPRAEGLENSYLSACDIVYDGGRRYLELYLLKQWCPE